MTVSAPRSFDVDYLRSQVIATYDRVAHEPDGEHRFHRGPEYARDYLGYDLE